MPGLVFCGRPSRLVAGDDLEVKCIVTICLRIVEIVLIVPALVLTVDNFGDGQECFENFNARHGPRIGILPASGYPTISFLASFLSICTDVAILFISGRGSPTEPQKRKPVGFLFAAQVVAMPFLLLALVILGVLAVKDAAEVAACIGIAADDGWMSALKAALCFQLVECCAFMSYLVNRVSGEFLRRVMSRSEQDVSVEEEAEDRAMKYEKRCQCCCKFTALCCCFTFGGRGIHNEDFSSISEALADLFQGWTLDIVPSDVRMAMHMLGLLQEERRQERLKQLRSEIDLTNSKLREIFDDSDAMSLLKMPAGYLFVSDAVKNALGFLQSSDIENAQDSADDLKVSGKEQAQSSGGAKSTSNRTLSSMTTTVKASDPVDVSPRRKQSLFCKAVKEANGKRYEFSPRSILSPSYDDDRYRIAEGARFMRYSDAINTWKNYVFTHLLTGFCDLTLTACSLKARRCRNQTSSAESSASLVVDDFAFPLHEAALLKVVGFDKSKVELAYAYFNRRTSVEGAVYCILVDHVWKSVVVCVRGSLSLADYVVNLDLAPESLEDAGIEFGFNGRGEFCHRGYMVRAAWIYEDMKKHAVLDSLLSEEGGKYNNYQLRITGHSLGAGTAAPLALLMRRDYPDLRCLCFGPPGGLFTLKTAQQCDDFVTTFVINADVVPRVSASTMRLLRDELLDLVARIKVPKRQVLKMRVTDQRLEDLPEGLGAFLFDEDDIPESDFSSELTKFKEHLSRCQYDDESSQRIQMFPPGKVVHLVKTSKRERFKEMIQGFFPLSNILNLLTCNRYVPKVSFTPTWASVDDFNEIIVTKTMVSDHMLDSFADAIGGVADEFGIDPSLPP